MAENKMRQVAKLLDVELDVPFNIKGINYNPYTLNKKGLFDYRGNKHGLVFESLLKGELKIEQLILTEKEKCYLESVIRPFKDKVRGVSKVHWDVQSFICIYIEKYADICLPPLEASCMYEGMKSNKFYTLEKLGLFQD